MQKLIKIEPKKFPVLIETDDEEKISLETMQKHVEGYIEHVTTELEKEGLELFCNEEGLFGDYGISAALIRYPQILSLIKGPIILTRTNENGNNCSVKDEDLQTVKNLFRFTTAAPYPIPCFEI